MEEMDCVDPIARAVEFLNSQKYNEAKAFLSEVAPDVIFTHGWDLVLPVLTAMEKEIDAKCDVNVCLCKELLEVIGSRGKPKEVLISLLEHLQLVKSSAGLHAVLQCFQKLLQGPLGNKLKFLDMILDSLYIHLKRLSASVAKNSGEQTSDDVSTETPESQNLGCCLNAMADFFSEVTRGCDLQKESRLVEDPRTENELFLKYLMLFLGEVGVLDLQRHPDTSPNFAHLSAERLVSHISSRSTDLIKLCISGEETRQCKEKSSDAEDTEKDLPEPVSPICRAVLAWSIFVENFEQDNVPCVYASRYVFEYNLQNIMILLTHSSGHVVVKGVALCANMVSRLNHGEFSSLDLDNSNLMSLLRCLGKVMIYSCSSKARKAALSVLVDYIKCFKYEARYILYCRMLQVEKHAGLHGLLIDLYRQDMHATLKRSNQDDTFLGVNFVEFLKIVVSNFSSQNLTDILDDSDSVLAVLNLLRYFAFVMPHQGQICAKATQSVCEIAENYTKQVKKSLDQTRIQYKAELEHSKEEVKSGKNPKDSLFPSLPPEQEADVLKTALTRLDLVESVLVLAVDSLGHCANQLLQ
ncbi:glomulin [Amblyomma americanum]